MRKTVPQSREGNANEEGSNARRAAAFCAETTHARATGERGCELAEETMRNFTHSTNEDGNIV